jgi:hypothetical protein
LGGVLPSSARFVTVTASSPYGRDTTITYVQRSQGSDAETYIHVELIEGLSTLGKIPAGESILRVHVSGPALVFDAPLEAWDVAANKVLVESPFAVDGVYTLAIPAYVDAEQSEREVALRFNTGFQSVAVIWREDGKFTFSQLANE